MTREEAKGNLIHAIRWNDMPKKEALDIAIKALMREPCNNYISRQAAIEALIEWYGCEPSDIGAFENIIEKLPSVKPERKKGEWKHVDPITETMGPRGWMPWYCSECGAGVGKHQTAFCPNCGADMRGGEDE